MVEFLRVGRDFVAADISNATASAPDADFIQEAQRLADTPYLAALFVSFPLFCEAWLFADGMPDGRARPFPASEDILTQAGYRVIQTPNFLTWSTASRLHAPLYKGERMQWRDHAPRPDLPPGPIQILVEVEYPHLSAHARLALKARTPGELALIGARFGWGEPLPAQSIALPEYFA